MVTDSENDREAPRALTSAACLARSADRARLWLSPIRIHRSTDLPHIDPGEGPTSLGPAWYSRRPPSPALRYWNMARQRYCRRLARYRNVRSVSADPGAKPAAHTRAESRGFGPSKVDAAERQTLCWREMDSNFRFPDAPSGRSAEVRALSSDREFAPLA